MSLFPHAPGRAGTYERQPLGYRAFSPAPLPPEPPIRLSGPLGLALSRADRALGGLDGAVRTLPDPGGIASMCARKEAVLSCRLAGSSCSLGELLAAEVELFGGGTRAHEVAAVGRCVEALNEGLARVAAEPVSVRLLCEVHERLLRDAGPMRQPPGELRRSQSWIGAAGCALEDASFVPPPSEAVPGAMEGLERFLGQPSGLPPLIEIGLAHAQFQNIHPFLEGSGRLGRLLIGFLIAERRLLESAVLYLSRHFQRHRADYEASLQGVRERGDWEGWLTFFLHGVAEVSAEATETVRRVHAVRERDRATLAARLGRAAESGHRVLEALFGRPVVTVADVQSTTGTTFAAANRLVARLCDSGLLVEVTGFGRNRRFLYEGYARLFSESESDRRVE